MADASENGSIGAPVAKFHFRHSDTYLGLFPGYERALDTLVFRSSFYSYS